MMTHDQTSEILAAFALDAVTLQEQEEVEAHLAECPRCRAELDAFRDVAAAMGNSVEPLPAGLWSSIASHLPERHAEDPPPMPRLFGADRAGDEVAAAREKRRLTRGPLAAIGSFAVAAAAAAAVLGIGLVHADNRASNLSSAAGANLSSTVVAALETPHHRVVNLESPTHAKLAQFVVVPDGRGYLVSSSLPALSSDQTYQLWGIIGHQPISLGLLGQAPKQVTFTMADVATPSRLSVTVEPAGGAVVPSSPVVASGTV
jgi:anti-sigma-K factor RskA